MPESLLPVKARIKELVPEMAAMHEQLNDTTISVESRKVLAGELCAKEDELGGLWAKIDEWKKSVGAPQAAPSAPQAPVDIYNQHARLNAEAGRVMKPRVKK
jgi:hypothetical protein